MKHLSVFLFLFVATACSNLEVSNSGDLCVRAATKVQDCLGTVVSNSTNCDETEARSLLDSTCDEIRYGESDEGLSDNRLEIDEAVLKEKKGKNCSTDGFCAPLVCRPSGAGQDVCLRPALLGSRCKVQQGFFNKVDCQIKEADCQRVLQTDSDGVGRCRLDEKKAQ